MTVEIRSFACTVPAGTPQNAPITIDVSFPNRTVTNVRIRIPPGPAGTTGFAIGAAGQIVIPSNDDAWIVGDNETMDWPLTDQHDSGSWEFFGYNTGIHDHTIYLQFSLDLTTSGDADPFANLIPSSALSAPPTPAPVIDTSAGG